MNHNAGATTEDPDPRSILSSLSRAELERIIRRRLDEGDDGLGELIRALEAEETDERSPAAIVGSLLRRYKSRGYEYIEDAYGFGRDLLRLRDRATDVVAKGDSVFAVQLLTQAIECAAPHAFDGGEDEESPILDAVNEGFERLLEMVRSSETDPAALRELGAWARRGVEAQWARAGDSWELSCLELSSASARGEAEVREALALCSRFVDGSELKGGGNYRAERGALIAADLLARSGDEAGRRGYMDAHVALDGIRRLAVEEATAAGDYGRAIELCEDGARSSRGGGRGGAAEEFEGLLIESLDRAGKKDEATRELGRFVTESFRTDRFLELRGRYSERGAWIEARERIVEALKGKRGSSYALAAVYDAEDMSAPLLAVAERNEYLFLDHLDTLGRAYPERAARFLKARIERDLRESASRGSYARGAEAILRYGTYAGKEAADALFDALISAYPARRAMREEFERARRKD